MENLGTRSEHHALHPEPGYDYVREIASGGYGHVYLFSIQHREQQHYVAGKFLYRHLFGDPNNAASTAAYERALEASRTFAH